MKSTGGGGGGGGWGGVVGSGSHYVSMMGINRLTKVALVSFVKIKTMQPYVSGNDVS